MLNNDHQHNSNEFVEPDLLHDRNSEVLARDQLLSFELFTTYLRRWESVCRIKR
jgi:hypothetical protein